ncbi:hypothetical protein HDE_12152 [Halotydeus destructor]|nr:hypothetical protein HDE_12152 [Halotydeus destructor]
MTQTACSVCVAADIVAHGNGCVYYLLTRTSLQCKSIGIKNRFLVSCSDSFELAELDKMAKLVTNMKRRIGTFVVKMKSREASDSESEYSDTDEEFEHGKDGLKKVVQVHSSTSGKLSEKARTVLNTTTGVRSFFPNPMLTTSRSAHNIGSGPHDGYTHRYLSVPTDRPVTPIIYKRRSSICMTK